jgi:lysophospholipase L1-like esterase
MRTSLLTAAICALAVSWVLAGPASAASYVALGDSYSAGTGAGRYRDAECERSDSSYPFLLHLAHPGWAFADVACSGATTADLLAGQIPSLTRETDWVTYTIGGNDAGFAAVLEACAPPAWLSDCDGAIDEARWFIRSELPGRLDAVNEAIAASAPRARVIALDYPRLFGARDCSPFIWLSAREMTRLNQAADLLRAVIQGAVARAGERFRFSDVIPAFARHEICAGGAGSDTEWINGLSAPLGESFHPNPRGHAGGYYPAVRAVTG